MLCVERYSYLKTSQKAKYRVTINSCQWQLRNTKQKPTTKLCYQHQFLFTIVWHSANYLRLYGTMQLTMKCT